MKHLHTTVRDNYLFYLPCLFFILLSSLLLLTVTKAESFISLNSFHSVLLNGFFVNYTFFGDGVFSLGLFAFLLYRKQKRLAMLILAAYLSSGLFTQILKNIIYAPRPRIYFEASQYLFRLDNFGNSGGGSSSFPSGHTTSAFALATVLAVYFKNKYWSILLLVAAALVGYSRIYLAQHFPADVLAGAFIGTVFATLSTAAVTGNIKKGVTKKATHPAQQWNNQLPHTAMY
jgi:membrane-associated phospholipid phosphatase